LRAHFGNDALERIEPTFQSEQERIALLSRGRRRVNPNDGDTRGDDQ
jgi:hypothetical protein